MTLRLIHGWTPQIDEEVRITESGPSGYQLRRATITFIDDDPRAKYPVTVRVEQVNTQHRRFAVLWDLRWSEIEQVDQ